MEREGSTSIKFSTSSKIKRSLDGRFLSSEDRRSPVTKPFLASEPGMLEERQARRAKGDLGISEQELSKYNYSIRSMIKRFGMAAKDSRPIQQEAKGVSIQRHRTVEPGTGSKKVGNTMRFY